MGTCHMQQVHDTIKKWLLQISWPPDLDRRIFFQETDITYTSNEEVLWAFNFTLFKVVYPIRNPKTQISFTSYNKFEP